jgi:hypothetical protein
MYGPGGQTEGETESGGGKTKKETYSSKSIRGIVLEERQIGRETDRKGDR